jgi:spore coat polysaccharide biosynthesis predicted glycosyltransferase SpsG
MNRDPILIRVDGTPRSGCENIYRCLTLALALQRRRRPTYFVSQLEPNLIAMQIKRAGHEWLNATSPAGTPEDLEELIREVHRLKPAAVVVDVPDVTEGYLTELRATGTTVINLDSSAGIRFPSRVVINPLLGPGKDDYEFVRGTQLLLGSRYVIVRPEIRRVRPLRSQEPPSPFRALVALGDDDPNDQALDLARFLLNVPKVERVYVAARSFHPRIDELKDLAANSDGRVEIASEPNEFTAKVARCHFAITAGNTWSLELACVGVPQLMILQNEVHWPNAKRLDEEGAANCLGWHEHVSAQTIRQAVQNLLADNLDRQAMTRCGRKLIDGRGPDRLVTAIEIILHSQRRTEISEAA